MGVGLDLLLDKAAHHITIGLVFGGVEWASHSAGSHMLCCRIRWPDSRKATCGGWLADRHCRHTTGYRRALAPRGATRPGFARNIPPLKQRAWGTPGARGTRSLVCTCSGRTHTSNNEYTESPGIPARNGFNGFLRALVSAKFARMCERAVLTNRPSLNLSPFVLEGQEPAGERGTDPVFPQPEQLHGLRARTEQGGAG